MPAVACDIVDVTEGYAKGCNDLGHLQVYKRLHYLFLWSLLDFQSTLDEIVPFLMHLRRHRKRFIGIGQFGFQVRF
jgi:hypothetical protein